MEYGMEQASLPKFLESIAFSDGGHLALTASNLTGKVWNGAIAIFRDPKFAPNVPHMDSCSETEAGCFDVHWIDNKRIAVCSDSGAVEVWSIIEDGHLLENSMVLLEHDDVCSSLSIDPSKLQIISGSWDGRVKVWDLSVELSVHTYSVHTNHVHSVAWNQKNAFFMASASEDGTVKVYDSREGRPASLLCYSDIRVPCSLEWYPGTDWTLAIGYKDGVIQMLDIRNPSNVCHNYHAHSKNVNKMLFLGNNDNWLASVSDDTSINIQDYEAGVSIYKDTRHSDYVRGLARNPVDKTVWTCSWDGQVLSHPVSLEDADKRSQVTSMET